MRQASRRSWRIGQTQPVQVVFMAYRNTLQADALKLVAQKLQSSLAVEGELPEDGLAAYGDDGDDLMLALARKIVAGEEDSGSVESVFEQARQVAAEAEALLVDEGWHAPEPEPVAAEPVAVGAGADDLLEEDGERQRSLFSWAEFMAGESLEPERPLRGEAPTLSPLRVGIGERAEGRGRTSSPLATDAGGPPPMEAVPPRRACMGPLVVPETRSLGGASPRTGASRQRWVHCMSRYLQGEAVSGRAPSPYADSLRKRWSSREGTKRA